jgi:hypothetical protein
MKPNFFADYNPPMQQQMQRLHEIMVYARWSVAVCLWVAIAPFCLWHLRSDIALWFDYFTWAAVRYSLAFNPVAAVGLALCIGFTVSVLLWQSHNILWGVSDRQKRRLENQLFYIQQQGASHPLWKWIFRE